MNSVKPIAGKDYPATWSDFEDWFACEEACAAYLEQLRWPQGFICPTCGVADHPRRTSRGRLSCSACRFQCSVTAGTIFDKTRTPLRVWFAAAWYITSQKQGISALGLQRVLGLTSYETAWAMLHRFWRAMVRPGRDWVFRKSVTGVFGIVTDGFGNVTGHFGDVTDGPSSVS